VHAAYSEMIKHLPKRRVLLRNGARVICPATGNWIRGPPEDISRSECGQQYKSGSRDTAQEEEIETIEGHTSHSYRQPAAAMLASHPKRCAVVHKQHGERKISAAASPAL
jgi:hypothetical protein